MGLVDVLHGRHHVIAVFDEDADKFFMNQNIMNSGRRIGDSLELSVLNVH